MIEARYSTIDGKKVIHLSNRITKVAVIVKIQNTVIFMIFLEPESIISPTQTTAELL